MPSSQYKRLHQDISVMIVMCSCVCTTSRRLLTRLSVRFFFRLLDGGVNGKYWRLIRSLYKNAVSRFHIGNRLSKSYVLERGVKQGSSLSPALFLLVMDPLLSLLESSHIGLSVNNLYAGGFIHADDIRTLASSSDSDNNC